MGGSSRNGGVSGLKEVCGSQKYEKFTHIFHRTSVYGG